MKTLAAHWKQWSALIRISTEGSEALYLQQMLRTADDNDDDDVV